MTTNAIAGVGATFGREIDTSTGNYDDLAEVNSINGPTMSREFIDVTSLDSSGGYREYITGFRDGGEVTLEMNFTIGGYAQLKVDFEADESHNYQITLPDTGTTTFTFAAYVTDMPLSVVPDDKVTVSVTFKITGQVTLTS